MRGVRKIIFLKFTSSIFYTIFHRKDRVRKIQASVAYKLIGGENV